jgi:hypothetical protein
LVAAAAAVACCCNHWNGFTAHMRSSEHLL